jgi:integrase
MKRQRLRIADYRHSSTTPYVLEGYRVNGKRKRLFFRTRAEAELELARLRIVQRKEGDAGAELGAEGRIEAVRCAQRLARLGKTLTDATDFLLEHLERQEKASATLTVDKLISERLAKLKNIGRSAAHIDDTNHHLSRFALAFGNRPAGAVTRQEIESWLETLQVGPRSYNNYCDRLNALFAFACKKELLTQNPLTRIERKNLPPTRTQIIAPADLGRLLDRAPHQLVPALAISYFAGLRTAEILRLSWDDINLTRGYIEVPAHKAKSAQRRLVSLEANLLEWLRPFAARRGGPVYNGSQKRFHAEVARLFAELGISRPSNCGRHSYASYWLAKHLDSASLAARLGHSTSQLIFAVYRELVSPEAAEAYWSICPPGIPSNVMAIA